MNQANLKMGYEKNRNMNGSYSGSRIKSGNWRWNMSESISKSS